MQRDRGLLVMVVDDGQGLAPQLASSIRAMGHQAEVSDSALALRLSRALLPDVVIVEFDWRVDMCSELTRKLSSQAGWRKPFIVALLNANESDADNWVGEAGIDLVMVKPIDTTVLSGVLRRFRNLLLGVEACRLLSEAEGQKLSRTQVDE